MYYFWIMDNHDEKNREYLTKLCSMQMPFGKFKGRILCDLPEPYLVWFNQNGYPEGEIGLLLQSLYEIKLNGLEHLLYKIKNTKK